MRIAVLWILPSHRIIVKIKASRKKRVKFWDFVREIWKKWNICVMVILIVIGTLGTIPKDMKRGLKTLELGGRIETIQIVEIDQNPEKCPGDQRRLAVSQTPVKVQQQMLVWKSLKDYNNDNNSSDDDHIGAEYVSTQFYHIYIYIYIYMQVSVSKLFISYTVQIRSVPSPHQNKSSKVFNNIHFASLAPFKMTAKTFPEGIPQSAWCT